VDDLTLMPDVPVPLSLWTVSFTLPEESPLPAPGTVRVEKLSVLVKAEDRADAVSVAQGLARDFADLAGAAAEVRPA
jgi:hypothetical protein